MNYKREKNQKAAGNKISGKRGENFPFYAKKMGKSNAVFIKYMTFAIISNNTDNILVDLGLKDQNLRYAMGRTMEEDFSYYVRQGRGFKELSYGDMLISFWTLFASLYKKEFGVFIHKNKSLDVASILREYMYDVNKRHEKVREIVDILEPLLEVYYTPGNIIASNLYQNMNVDRYQRNEDRPDLMMKDILSGYKGVKEKEALDFIKANHLEVMFKYRKVEIGNIKYLIGNEKKISKMNKRELKKYISKAVEVIKQRNELIAKSYKMDSENNYLFDC